MMESAMPKKQMPSPIYLFWERVVFPEYGADYLPPSAQSEWQILWNAHIEGDHLAQTDAEDAHLLCYLGAQLAHRGEDIASALQRILRWFDHPDWQQVDHTTQDMMHHHAALYHLLLGEEANAFARLRALLARHRPHYPLPSQFGRILLRSYCNEQPPERDAPEELVSLTVALLETQRGTKRWVKYLQTADVTMGDILNALGGPFPSEGDLGSSGTTAAVSP
jgi:hypothetical protein